MEQKKGRQGLLAFFGARGRLWILLGGVIAGIFLILLGSAVGGENDTEQGTLSHEDLEALLSYETRLEKEIAALCGEVAGVSHVEVLVHLSGGTRVIYATDATGKPVSVGSGSEKEALQATVRMPEIAGVGIVCRGGSDPAVQQKLTDLISTALGIPTSRVAITGK